FGQDHAIKQIVNAIKLSRSGLGHPEKPIGSFLFSGPTGVGKTELAKQLAVSLGVEFIRFDMSEYMESHTVSRLIGAPPGYVGFDQGGLLTDAIIRTPYAVLVLDAAIGFDSLSLARTERVVDKFVDELRAQLAPKSVALELREGGRAWLAKNGYDRAFGARPMARLIQQKIKEPLVDAILFGSL